MSPRVAQLLDTMSDVPTIAVSRLGDPVASNALGRAVFPHLFPDDAKPLNFARYMFLDPRAQTFYTDWETTAREGVSGLRLLAGQDPSDRALMALVGELATRSDDFRTWWGGHTVRVHASGTKSIHHPVVGEMALGYETVVLPSAPGLSVVAYLPEPGSSSADALEMLRSWIAQPSASVQAPQRKV